VHQYHLPDGATAAAFYDRLISRDFSCFDKKRTIITIVINIILFSMKLTKYYWLLYVLVIWIRNLITKHQISITSNKSLSNLQLVCTSNWSSFRHGFVLRGFVSVRLSCSKRPGVCITRPNCKAIGQTRLGLPDLPYFTGAPVFQAISPVSGLKPIREAFSPVFWLLWILLHDLAVLWIY